MNPLDTVISTQAALQSSAPELDKLKKACQGLEASFLQTVVGEMRKGTDDVHFGQQLGGDTFQSMFDDTLADILAQKNSMGVSQAMYAPLAQQVMQKATLAQHGQDGQTTEGITH